MDFSSPAALRLRAIGQRLGVLPPLVRAYRRLAGKGYEERFDRALTQAIRPGDCVWDVGANVGLYTERFADQVTDQGRVLAFEPSPRNIRQLTTRFATRPTVVLCPVGLGATAGTIDFYVNEADDLGTTDSLFARGPNAVTHPVEVRVGDDYLAAHPPQVIKIDVEGFEPEVLAGLSRTLRSPTLRAVLIEVHFSVLNQRGLPEAPRRLVEILTAAGLRVTWVDASHLVAERIA